MHIKNTKCTVFAFYEVTASITIFSNDRIKCGVSCRHCSNKRGVHTYLRSPNLTACTCKWKGTVLALYKVTASMAKLIIVAMTEFTVVHLALVVITTGCTSGGVYVPCI